jgi:hypothetical protein
LPSAGAETNPKSHRRERRKQQRTEQILQSRRALWKRDGDTG